MSYFKKVKTGRKVFGMVYGKGVVKSVWENSHYTFEVEYKNGSVVPYTPDGFPAWNTGKLDFQTVFYSNDIDVCELDFSVSNDELSAKKIIKLRDNKKLEVKCPSGIWQDISKCPSTLVQEYLEDGKLYLFRKTIKFTDDEL